MIFNMPNINISIIFAIGACAVCWVITGIFLCWAMKNRFFDFPNERSSHMRPTPRGGGIGIVVAVLAGTVVISNKYLWIMLHEPLSIARVGSIIIGTLLLIAISWMDDFHHELSPGMRLAVHTFAAGLALIGLGGWMRIILPIIGRIELGWIGIPVSLFWIVSLVNVYNFMDGIDGIASIQAVTAAMGWFSVGVLSHNAVLYTYGIVIGFSAIGFLIYNWPPAKIFMGDIGSAFLGFVFAVIPLSVNCYCPDLIMDRIPVAGFLMVAPFVVDATFTLLRRISRKENISQAHRSHLYQRLVLSGLSHRTVTLLYLALGIVGSTAGVSFVLIANRKLSDGIVIGAIIIILLVPISLTTKREHDNVILLRK